MLRIGTKIGRLPQLGKFSPAWQPPDLVAKDIKSALLDVTADKPTSSQVIDHTRPDLATEWDEYLAVIAQLDICSCPSELDIRTWSDLVEKVGGSHKTLLTPGLRRELEQIDWSADSRPLVYRPRVGRSRAEIETEVRAWFRVWIDELDN